MTSLTGLLACPFKWQWHAVDIIPRKILLTIGTGSPSSY